MSLSFKITSVTLLTLSVLMFLFGWFSILDEEQSLESVLQKHGNALAKVVSGFSVDPLLLEDYPVLETVLGSFGAREENILAIEVMHNDRIVASYRKSTAEKGRSFISAVEFNDADSGLQSRLGEVLLTLSQRDNREIIAARQAQILRYFVIAFLVLMLALMVILRKTILERIRALTLRIEKISSEIEVSTPQAIQFTGAESEPDEIGALGSRFDAMVDRVRHHNRALREKVAERTADLEAAKEAAERANSAKSRFLASASHDLRQPLQALSMYSGALESKVRDPETLNVVERISNGIQTMNEMLTTLLDVSRLEAGVIAPVIRPLALSALFNELDAEFSPLAENKGLTLRVCRTSLMTDSAPVLLDRILRNLVSNAVRYTEQGKILLGCRRHGRCIRVEVHDSGIGYRSFPCPGRAPVLPSSCRWLSPPGRHRVSQAHPRTPPGRINACC